MDIYSGLLEHSPDLKYTFNTASGEETIDLGRSLGTALKPFDVVALTGELGSGKTWFTKGLAIGLGVPPEIIITSPSFSLVNEYEGRCPLFHMDAYRLDGASEFISAGLEEYFNREGVTVIEWADRCPEAIPSWRLLGHLAIVGLHTRKISLFGNHPRVAEILRSLPKQT